MPGRDFSKDSLTNEKVKTLPQFTNQFDLVNFTIGLAREIIKGRHPTVESDNQNIAVQALMELTSEDTEE